MDNIFVGIVSLTFEFMIFMSIKSKPKYQLHFIQFAHETDFILKSIVYFIE